MAFRSFNAEFLLQDNRVLWLISPCLLALASVLDAQREIDITHVFSLLVNVIRGTGPVELKLGSFPVGEDLHAGPVMCALAT